MNFPIGSTAWLLAHEIRLAWRTALRGKVGRRRLIIVSGLLTVGTAAIGLPAALLLRHVQIHVSPVAVAVSDVALAALFTLMLSQTLSGTVETFYTRGDLDLLLSSPLAPRKVLSTRVLAMAANVFTGSAVLITPVLLPVALLGHPTWIAVYGVLAALALGASAVGLVLALGLFRVIGPLRTRAVAQVMAAVIGGAFFLVTQVRNILGAHETSVWMDVAASAARSGVHRSQLAALPLRALLGGIGPLVALLAFGALLLAAATVWIGARFGAIAALANGAPILHPRRPSREAPFAGGAFAATVKKELRLLGRDAALLSQVLLRLLYLVPLIILALRNASGHAHWALPSGVAAVTLMVGQVAASLSWITFSAEDTPELLRSAPAAFATLSRAKMTAALGPLAALMFAPLLVLIVISPRAGLAAMAGCLASGLACGLINSWRRGNGKRAEFLRRGTVSYTVAIAQFVIGALIAAAAGLAAAGSLIAPAPLILAGGVLFALRRSDEAIIEATR